MITLQKAQYRILFFDVGYCTFEAIPTFTQKMPSAYYLIALCEIFFSLHYW